MNRGVKTYHITATMSGQPFSEWVKEWTAQRAFRKVRRRFPDVTLMRATVVS